MHTQNVILRIVIIVLIILENRNFLVSERATDTTIINNFDNLAHVLYIVFQVLKSYIHIHNAFYIKTNQVRTHNNCVGPIPSVLPRRVYVSV